MCVCADKGKCMYIITDDFSLRVKNPVNRKVKNSLSGKVAHENFFPLPTLFYFQGGIPQFCSNFKRFQVRKKINYLYIYPQKEHAVITHNIKKRVRVRRTNCHKITQFRQISAQPKTKKKYKKFAERTILTYTFSLAFPTTGRLCAKKNSRRIKKKHSRHFFLIKFNTFFPQIISMPTRWTLIPQNPQVAQLPPSKKNIRKLL